MPVDLTEPNQIILIGPCGSGKTTIGTMLAERLNSPFASLDAVERTYTVPAGFDPDRAEELRNTGVPFAGYAYRRMFFDDAVIGFLADYPRGVLELGGGHPIIPDPEKQARVTAALRPYSRIILLLPTADLRESVALLRARYGVADGKPDLNELFIVDDTFFKLARFVVYTQGKTPDETGDEVLVVLGITPGPRLLPSG
jgi:hypothetical protein